MRKGIAFLFRYQQVSAQSNARYLDALACVDDPTPAIRELDAITRAATTPNGRTARPFNPLSREDRTLFEVLLAGEYALHGFTNRDLRSKLDGLHSLSPKSQKSNSARSPACCAGCTPTA
jgi:hypothetical protein